MARWEPEQTVTQSVLERLIDREPGAASEAAPTRAQTVRLLRASVRRDLEWLLNTRRTPAAADEAYPEVAKSVYNYGLPDLNALNWESSRDRTRLARAVQESLNIFEPRLRVMRFQIEGLLEMDPAPEHIVFDTTLQLSSGEYQVKGDSNAG
jgi:type VI secretion system protein ImpF